MKTTYTRFERSISSVSLLGGFIFDAVTLKRVDAFWENFWIVAHLAVVAICILVINRTENSGADPKDPSKAHFWFINMLQFFFGGLLSTLLVFYFPQRQPSRELAVLPDPRRGISCQRKT